jgi:hypothetical protein
MPFFNNFEDELKSQRVFLWPSGQIPYAYGQQLMGNKSDVDTSPLASKSMQAITGQDPNNPPPPVIRPNADLEGVPEPRMMSGGSEVNSISQALAAPPSQAEIAATTPSVAQPSPDMFKSGAFNTAMGLLASHFGQTVGQLQAGKALTDIGTKQTEDTDKQKAASALGLATGGGNVDTAMAIKKLSMEERRTAAEEKTVDQDIKLKEQQILNMRQSMGLTSAQEAEIRQNIESNKPMVVDMGDGRSVTMKPLDYYSLKSRIFVETAHAHALEAEAKLKKTETNQLLNTTDFMDVKGVPVDKVLGYKVEIEKSKIAERSAANTAGIAASASRYHTDKTTEVMKLAYSPEKDTLTAAKSYRELLVKGGEDLAKQAPMMWIKTDETHVTLNPQYKQIMEERAAIAGALFQNQHASEADRTYAKGLIDQMYNSKVINAAVREKLLTGPLPTPIPQPVTQEGLPATKLPPTTQLPSATNMKLSTPQSNQLAPPAASTEFFRGPRRIGEALGGAVTKTKGLLDRFEEDYAIGSALR